MRVHLGDGKRSCDGRSIGGSGSDYSKEGGGLGQGGLQVLPDTRLADFFLAHFMCVLSDMRSLSHNSSI